MNPHPSTVAHAGRARTQRTLQTSWPIEPNKRFAEAWHNGGAPDGWETVSGAWPLTLVVTSRRTGEVQGFVVQSRERVVVTSFDTPEMQRVASLLNDWSPINTSAEDVATLARHMPRGLKLQSVPTRQTFDDAGMARLAAFLGKDLGTATVDGLGSVVPLHTKLPRRVGAPYVEYGQIHTPRRGMVTSTNKSGGATGTSYSRSNMLMALEESPTVGEPVVVALVTAPTDGSNVAVSYDSGRDATVARNLERKLERSGDVTWHGLRRLATTTPRVIGPLRHEYRSRPDPADLIGQPVSAVLEGGFGMSHAAAQRFLAREGVVLN